MFSLNHLRTLATILAVVRNIDDIEFLDYIETKIVFEEDLLGGPNKSQLSNLQP